jgi:hypothetical protein
MTTIRVTGKKSVTFAFLHVTVIQSTLQSTTEPILLPPGHPSQQEEIEGKLDKARDWLRYAPNCWLLYTSFSASEWGERLRSLPTMEGCRLLVCEVNLKNKGGWLPRSAWDWMNKDR